MKNFKVSEDSLSYKWNTALYWKYGSGYKPRDFCTYWRHTLLWSPITLLFIMLTALYALFAIGLLVYSVFTEPLILVAPVLTFLTVTFFVHLISKYSKQIDKLVAPPFKVFMWPILKTFSLIGSGIYHIVMWYNSGKVPVDENENYITSSKVRKANFLDMIWLKIVSTKEEYCPMVEYEKNSEKVS